MIDTVISELVIAAIIGICSFLGTLIAVKVELKFIRRDLEKLTQEVEENKSALNGLKIEFNALEVRQTLEA